ncbi:MAG: vitamin K epoxide reductase family protein [Candidatus Rokubacteria bacterium]|nr:vitamin K epoxide reductase family protein [Candidatus Rokubacteria bacterium]
MLRSPRAPGDLPVAGLRAELQHSTAPSLRRRRAIVGISLVGMAAMAGVLLLQAGIVRHLPDPPLSGFDSDRVNSSDLAYGLGVPDGAVSLASLAMNVPAALLGGADRAERHPLVPLAVGMKAAIEAVVSAWYFDQMPARAKAWCGYCIVGALASFAVFGLAMPEALAAARARRRASSP